MSALPPSVAAADQALRSCSDIGLLDMSPLPGAKRGRRPPRPNPVSLSPSQHSKDLHATHPNVDAIPPLATVIAAQSATGSSPITASLAGKARRNRGREQGKGKGEGKRVGLGVAVAGMSSWHVPTIHSDAPQRAALASRHARPGNANLFGPSQKTPHFCVSYASHPPLRLCTAGVQSPGGLQH